jgi:hypothetical protein
MVAAVPGSIITLQSGTNDFQVTHQLQRGTRPLHICSTPTGHVFWGEYFDNKDRSEVYIYGSLDGGRTWQIVYTFAATQIRHIHNIVYDQWRRCLWVLTGDYGNECRILRASPDFKYVDEVLTGNQQTRAVAAVPAPEGLYFASDTPLEHDYIYRLNDKGKVHQLCGIPSSAIGGCSNRDGIFVSTMVEPSDLNKTRDATVFASGDGENWSQVAKWRKDRWSMRLFQYGTALFPSGNNSADLLAVSTIALSNYPGIQTTIYRTSLS